VVKPGTHNCVVLTGDYLEPYTGAHVFFIRGQGTSAAVEIDHVVALSNAWQTGAQQMDPGTRLRYANDPLVLLAVDGPANQQKGDGDAATWLPANKSFRCSYVARQIAIKAKYHLWLTPPEKDAMGLPGAAAAELRARKRASYFFSQAMPSRSGSVRRTVVLAFILLEVLGGRHAVGEGDGERVQAGFHRMVHRACPVPLGSMPRVTRYRVFKAACWVGKWPLTVTARR